jgi:hypothetical protein
VFSAQENADIEKKEIKVKEIKFDNIFNLNNKEFSEERITFTSNLMSCKKHKVSSKNKNQKLEILGKSSNSYLYKNKCVVDIVSDNKITTCLYPFKSLDKIAGAFSSQYFSTGKVNKKYNNYCIIII